MEDDGLSSQNESDESQDRFSYKEFDSGGNSMKYDISNFRFLVKLFISLTKIFIFLCFSMATASE